MNDIGAQSPSNEHVDRMAGILLTYNFYEKELGMSSGVAVSIPASCSKHDHRTQDTFRACRTSARLYISYLQGMNPLRSGVLLRLWTEWYVGLSPESTRSNSNPFLQKQNFLRDQSGMKKQLSMLQQLIEIMDPELFRHLEKTDALNLFFCFR